MINQDELRVKTRVAVAENTEYTFKIVAEEILEIKQFSFYNWLANKYSLSENKSKMLDNWLNDLLE